MKFFALASLAIASVAAWSTEPCPDSELLKLFSIIGEPSRQQCEDDSGYTFVPPPGPPTDEQVSLMCLSTACNKTISALIALDPADCVTSFSTGSGLNVKQLVTELVPKCQA